LELAQVLEFLALLLEQEQRVQKLLALLVQ
jgi:hypothetical protein